MKLLVICALLSWTLVSEAWAASDDAVTGNSSGSDLIFVGQINGKSVDDFLEKNKDTHAKSMIIFSTGGEVLSALKLAHWVREHGLDLRVRTLCMSACANYVFPAANRKIIERGALVIWHGGIEQKDVREGIAYYDAQLAKSKTGDNALTSSEKEFLTNNQIKYESAKKIRLMQAELFSQLGIDEYITRLGQEPIWYKVDGWTATIELMNKMGIKNVEANPNYASANYLKRNLIANIQSGGEPIVFGLDSAGKIVTLNQIPPEPQ